eukprot:1147332-Amphidinium_carterae.1
MMVAKSMDAYPNARTFLTYNTKYLELSVSVRDKVTLDNAEQMARHMYLQARNRTRETKFEERVTKQMMGC